MNDLIQNLIRYAQIPHGDCPPCERWCVSPEARQGAPSRCSALRLDRTVGGAL